MATIRKSGWKIFLVGITMALTTGFLAYRFFSLALHGCKSGTVSILASSEPVVETLVSVFVFREPFDRVRLSAPRRTVEHDRRGDRNTEPSVALSVERDVHDVLVEKTLDSRASGKAERGFRLRSSGKCKRVAVFGGQRQSGGAEQFLEGRTRHPRKQFGETA